MLGSVFVIEISINTEICNLHCMEMRLGKTAGAAGSRGESLQGRGFFEV